MRTGIAAVLVAMLAPAAAVAGDYADLTIVGFSPDGGYFAFIEHGVQDGSGWPFANAYVIDTNTDSWVSGTPVRILIEDEDQTEAEAYARASQGIAPLVKRLSITRAATIVADNPITEISADPHTLSFVPIMISPPNRSKGYKLTLSEYTLPAPDCPDMGPPFVGFRLVLTDLAGRPRTIHEDAGNLPDSRHCPTGYGISAVVFDPDRRMMVVMIDVFSIGFEGPDRRFIALTSPFE